MMQVPFVDLRAQYTTIAPEVQGAIHAVLERSDFILGCEVDQFEEEFGQYIGTRHAIGVGSGLAALELALRAYGIGPGDEVITAANTFIATVLAIMAVGARPVLVDAEAATYNLDPAVLASAITSRTRAIIPVHLYGQPADMEPILVLAKRHHLVVIEDAAQAHGATYDGRRAGAWGDAAAFSFYPAKNLGACGDAGMVVTNDEALAAKLRMLRVHGVERRYFHDLHGYNSRLDELQAAILRVKLSRLKHWNARRAEIAARYSEGLKNSPLELPVAGPGNTHVYHVYAVLTSRRDELQEFLAQRGVPTIIYYPLPLHLQKVYSELGHRAGDFPAAEAVSKSILPLPIYPELTDDQVDYVVEMVRQFFYLAKSASLIPGAG